MLARITGVPVQWAEDRSEALIASVHSRPQVHDVTAAYDDDGHLLALSVDVTSDVGNPVLYFSGIGPSLVTVGARAAPTQCPSTAGRCRASRPPPARWARTEGSGSRRRTSPSNG